jgi:hypothetical protein
MTTAEQENRKKGSARERTREPLPERWVDLIHHLNEQERRRSKHAQAETEPHERHSH